MRVHLKEMKLITWITILPISSTLLVVAMNGSIQIPKQDEKQKIELTGIQYLAVEAAWKVFSNNLKPQQRNISWHQIEVTKRGDQYLVEFSPKYGRNPDKIGYPETDVAGSGLVAIDATTLQPVSK